MKKIFIYSATAYKLLPNVNLCSIGKKNMFSFAGNGDALAPDAHDELHVRRGASAGQAVGVRERPEPRRAKVPARAGRLHAGPGPEAGLRNALTPGSTVAQGPGPHKERAWRPAELRPAALVPQLTRLLQNPGQVVPFLTPVFFFTETRASGSTHFVNVDLDGRFYAELYFFFSPSGALITVLTSVCMTKKHYASARNKSEYESSGWAFYFPCFSRALPPNALPGKMVVHLQVIHTQCQHFGRG